MTFSCFSLVFPLVSWWKWRLMFCSLCPGQLASSSPYPTLLSPWLKRFCEIMIWMSLYVRDHWKITKCCRKDGENMKVKGLKLCFSLCVNPAMSHSSCTTHQRITSVPTSAKYTQLSFSYGTLTMPEPGILSCPLSTYWVSHMSLLSRCQIFF